MGLGAGKIICSKRYNGLVFWNCLASMNRTATTSAEQNDFCRKGCGAMRLSYLMLPFLSVSGAGKQWTGDGPDWQAVLAEAMA